MSSTVGWLLRSEQAYCMQLCEKETLDYGIASYNERFREHPEANQFREVLIEDPAQTEAAFSQAESWFRARGLICHRWVPAGGQADESLRSFLTSHGFAERTLTALALGHWVDLKPSPSVRVLPARAMRAAFRETLVGYDQRRFPISAEVVREAYEQRLDDAPFEMMVALVDKKPAGRCAFYQVGDIGRVIDLTVLPSFAGKGVDEALLANALALAKRLALKNICTMVEESDAARSALCKRAGFVADGQITEFDRATERAECFSPRPDR